MFCDLALAYDRDQRRCDLVIGADGDLVIDETPVPAILTSVGLDRRATPDDPLPDGRTQFLAPVSFSERRGSIGDGFDPFGDLTGSKMWLLNRAKQTETTRLLALHWLTESMAWAEKETGTPAVIDVWWVRQGVLGYRIQVQDASVSLSKRVDA